MLGLLLKAALGITSSVGTAIMDDQAKRSTFDGTTYMKHTGGKYLAYNDHPCGYEFVHIFSDGTSLHKYDVADGAQDGDYVLRDHKTDRIVRNFTAEQRNKKF